MGRQRRMALVQRELDEMAEENRELLKAAEAEAEARAQDAEETFRHEQMRFDQEVDDIFNALRIKGHTPRDWYDSAPQSIDKNQIHSVLIGLFADELRESGEDCECCEDASTWPDDYYDGVGYPLTRTHHLL